MTDQNEHEKSTEASGSRQEPVVVRAFKTTATGITSIVFAESAGKARYTTYLAARDVGYKIGFPDVTVRRAPEFDQRRTVDDRIPTLNMCHAPENLASV